MGPHGPWVPMGRHGFPWVAMGSHGSPWVAMGSHGPHWVPGYSFLPGFPVTICNPDPGYNLPVTCPVTYPITFHWLDIIPILLLLFICIQRAAKLRPRHRAKTKSSKAAFCLFFYSLFVYDILKDATQGL